MDKSWIISFYSDNEQVSNDNRENHDFLSWSSYDRVEISEASSFKEICQNGSNQKEWNGITQYLHLIPDIKNMPNYSFTWKTSAESRRMIESDFGLYCLINLKFNQDILSYYNTHEFAQLASELKRIFYKRLNSYILKESLACEFYGFQSLSTEDVVLIILANDIITFNNIVCYIKNLDFEKNKKVFELVSLFTGLNYMEYNDVDPGLDLKVKLYLKPNISIKEAIAKFEKEYYEIIGNDKKYNIKFKLEILSGADCLEIFIPHSPKVLSLFHKNNVLNGSYNFYPFFLKNSKTYWVKEISQSDSAAGKDYSEPLLKNELKIKLCNSINSEFHYDDNDILNPVAQFINNEYKRLIESPKCSIWKGILKSQYTIVLKLIKEYQKNDEKTLCSLLNHVQTALIFINQACLPVHEVPSNNYFYSCSYNDLLKMYYGIISQIITIGYRYEHDDNTNQHPLYFAVNFEATTNIHSIMYTLSDKADRFIIFHLPYDDIYNYPKMIKYLVHEVFHYIAPYSRLNRVKNFFKLSYVQVLGIIIEENCLEIKTLITEKFYENLDKYIDNTISCFKDNDIDLSKYTLNDFCNTFLNQNDVFLLFINIIELDVINFIDDFKKNYPTKEALYDLTQKLKVKKLSNTLWLLDFWRNIILGSKEAFCDSFIIDILDMDLNDYFKTIKDTLFKKENSEIMRNIISESNIKYNISSSLGQKINFESLEIRIILMLEYFYRLDKTDNQFTEWVKDKLDKIPKDNDWEYFNKYVNEVVSNVNLFQYIGFMYDIAFENKNNSKYIKGDLEFLNNLKAAVTDNPDKDINLDTIYKFKYCPLPEYKQVKVKSCISSVKIKKWDVMHISSFEKYIDEIIQIIKSNKISNKLWFRGVCNHNYDLEPSLFRALNNNLSLYSNQANIIKKAYEATLEYSNLWKSTIIERTALLQHYGMATNLLDFTFNIFSALHFAINPDSQKDRNDLDCGKYMPVIYAFDPIEYNKAIAFLKTEIPFEKNYNCSPIIFDIDNNNLSNFFVNDMTYDYLIEHTRIHNEKYIPCNRTDDYPMPIIVQQSNKRIQAQNGSFVAFSLNAKPEFIDGKPSYTYLALNKIQERYKRELERKNLEVKNFLYRIYVHPNAVMSLRADLKKINISVGKMYPEYSKIFEEAMKEYKDQLGF